MNLRYKHKNNFISYFEFLKICISNYGKGKVIYKSKEHNLEWDKN